MCVGRCSCGDEKREETNNNNILTHTLTHTPSNGNLVYIRYKDHVLFKNSNPLSYSPNERETVGWLISEKDEALYLIHDRSVKPIRFEKNESGLIIIKSNIIEKKIIE